MFGTIHILRHLHFGEFWPLPLLTSCVMIPDPPPLWDKFFATFHSIKIFNKNLETWIIQTFRLVVKIMETSIFLMTSLYGDPPTMPWNRIKRLRNKKKCIVYYLHFWLWIRLIGKKMFFACGNVTETIWKKN